MLKTSVRSVWVAKNSIFKERRQSKYFLLKNLMGHWVSIATLVVNGNPQQMASSSRFSDVFKTSLRRFQNAFNMSWKRLAKTSSKSLQYIFKTSSRRLQDVFKTYHQVKLLLLTPFQIETYSKHFWDVLERWLSV